MSERELPPGWGWAALEQLSKNIVDCLHSTPKFTQTGKLCIDTTCIKPGRIIFGQARFVSEETYNERVRRLIPEGGDILFAREGTIGTAVVVPEGVDLCLGQRMMMFRPENFVASKYFMWAMMSPLFEQQWKPKVIGTTSPHVNIADLRVMTLPLPPLPEQHRIVAEIEKQFTRLDAGIAALKRVRANLRRYRAAVLKAACEGRLVPTEAELARAEGRDYEPADHLLQRILTERRKKWAEDLRAKGKDPKAAKYQEPAAPVTEDLPELPEGWVWASAEQLSDETRAITYGVIKLGKPVEDGVPTLRSSNVRHLHLDLNNVKLISHEIAKNYKRTFLDGGEVLVTVRGTLGGVVTVPQECKGFNISREVAMIALVEPRLGPVVSLFIGSNVIQNWLLQRIKGIAYVGINIETLKQTPVPLPPVAEQQRIVAEVERRLSVVEELEATVEASLKRAERLRQAIVKRAFEGRLAPQDPNDEPASKLLERIKRERGKAAGKKNAKQLPLPEV